MMAGRGDGALRHGHGWVVWSGVCAPGALATLVQDLSVQRPFFLPPVLVKQKVERPFLEVRLGRQAVEPCRLASRAAAPWQLLCASEQGSGEQLLPLAARVPTTAPLLCPGPRRRRWSKSPCGTPTSRCSPRARRRTRPRTCTTPRRCGLVRPRRCAMYTCVHVPVMRTASWALLGAVAGPCTPAGWSVQDPCRRWPVLALVTLCAGLTPRCPGCPCACAGPRCSDAAGLAAHRHQVALSAAGGSRRLGGERSYSTDTWQPATAARRSSSPTERV
jgi:hypothetical protein